MRAFAGDDALENLGRPRGALAALRALRAALVREEACGTCDLLHEILRVVDDDDASGAEHRAVRHEALVVHQRGFRLVARLDGNRDAAGNDGLELTAGERASAQ